MNPGSFDRCHCFGLSRLATADAITPLGDGQVVFLVFDDGSNRLYLDGRTRLGDAILRPSGHYDEDDAWTGTRWKVHEFAPSVYGFASLGGGSQKWLNGKTASSGAVTLESRNYVDSRGLGGTRWRLFRLNNGKYAIESMGGGERKWLCANIADSTVRVRENDANGDPPAEGRNWKVVQRHNQRNVFVGGTGDYHTYRIPSVLVAPDGSLLAFAEGRKNSQRDTGDIDLVLRRSTDGGLTWGPTRVIWNDGENTCGNPTSVMDRDTGRIWLFTTHNLDGEARPDIVEGRSDGRRTVWYAYSDDSGASWSHLHNISAQVQIPGTRWDATGPGVGIQSRAGTLIIPAIGRNIQSDDHGRTWYRSGTVLDGSSEVQIVELSDGSLMRNARPAPPFRDDHRRMISVSDDHGQTWSPLAQDTELPDPACQGCIFRYSFADEAERSRVIFSNPNHESRRINMTVRLSYDEGQTWLIDRQLWAGPSAYSCLTVLPDGTIGLLFEAGHYEADHFIYERIIFARFSLDWLTRGVDPWP